jgi:hypothetical protein
MPRFAVPVGVALLLAVPTTAAAKPVFLPQQIAKTVLLNVPLIPQATCCWCWAASGDMVMTYTGHPMPQCKQAAYQFGQSESSCCASTPAGACVSGGIVEIGHYGFTFQQTGDSTPLTPAQIEDQISNKHMPWILNPHSTGFGHVTVGVGYKTFFGKLTAVAINDPWAPGVGDFYWETYDSYACGFWSTACHVEGYDLYDIKPPALPRPQIPILAEYQPRIPPEELNIALAGDPDPQKAAQAALPLFAELTTAETAPRLGIESDALRHARFSAPIPVMNVSIERLRNWRRGSPTEGLMQQEQGMIVPLEIDGRVRAVVRLRRDGGRWKVATFGGRAFSQAWERIGRARGQVLVEVEGLELAYAGRREGGRLILTPLFAEPRLQIEAGREAPAEDHFARLVETAASYRPNINRQQGR